MKEKSRKILKFFLFRQQSDEGKDEDHARLDLERWLVSLTENPSLASNPDLKEFLSYETEENLAVNRKGGPPVLPSSAVSQNPRIDKVYILDLLFLLYCYHFLKTEYLYINHFFFNIIKVSKRHPTKYCISIFQSLNFVRLTSPDLSKTHNSVLFFKF